LQAFIELLQQPFIKPTRRVLNVCLMSLRRALNTSCFVDPALSCKQDINLYVYALE